MAELLSSSVSSEIQMVMVRIWSQVKDWVSTFKCSDFTVCSETDLSSSPDQHPGGRGTRSRLLILWCIYVSDKRFSDVASVFRPEASMKVRCSLKVIRGSFSFLRKSFRRPQSTWTSWTLLSIRGVFPWMNRSLSSFTRRSPPGTRYSPLCRQTDRWTERCLSLFWSSHCVQMSQMNHTNQSLVHPDWKLTSSNPLLSISVTHSVISRGTLGWVSGAKPSNKSWRGKKLTHLSQVSITCVVHLYQN